MVRWVIGSIHHGGPIELFLVPASAPRLAAVGFLSRYLNCPLLYVRRHITIKQNVLSASLNKIFPSLVPNDRGVK